MRAAFYTLGCKVNQYETQILQQYFSAEGFDIVEPEDDADVYVVNSCTVTASGDKKSRQALRHFKRQNPAAVTVLTGCFPQAFPDAAQQIPEADVITGSYNRASVLEAVKQRLATGERVVRITPHPQGVHRREASFEQMKATAMHERTRAFVKIQDGCDRFCSYCIIPMARGPVRSKPLEEIREELTALAKAGYREVVLVGINLPCYGSDLGLRLLDAVSLACNIPGISRVRLGSLEPELLTPEDIAAMAAMPSFCPQFHLSLQSGCDATLRRMNRHYDTAEYRRIVENLRAAFPNPSITTDIMVGFAGETEEEFAQSLDFAREIGFAKAHVFAYSIRPGTRAASMPGQLTNACKEQRSAAMIAVTDATRKEFLQRQVGLVEEVLFETSTAGGMYHGYTPNYTPVAVASPENLCGRLCNVRITGLSQDGDGCVGTVEM